MEANDIVKVIQKQTINKTEYRIVYIKSAPDFLEDSNSVDKAFVVQKRKRFLFIKYWSDIKTYLVTDNRVRGLQKYNAIVFLNNLK